MNKIFNFLLFTFSILLFTACQFMLEEPLLTTNNTTFIKLEDGLYEGFNKASAPILGKIEITKQKKASNAFFANYLHNDTLVEMILEPLNAESSLYVLQQQEIDANKNPINYPTLTIINIENNIIKADFIKIVLSFVLNSISDDSNFANTSEKNNFEKGQEDFLNLLTKYNLEFKLVNVGHKENSESDEKFFLEVSNLQNLKFFLLELRENKNLVETEALVFKKTN